MSRAFPSSHDRQTIPTGVMRVLDLTLPSPGENLAADEALLLEARDGGGGEVLRFWMSPTPFVVVGLGAKVEREVHLDACTARQIPILRRCSGGGTVVQGRGCLNYSLILQIQKSGPLNTVTGTNRWIMQRNADALSPLAKREVTVKGHTDLVIKGVKFSGNAQRRLQTHLLFHGTFLLDFDLPLITALLPAPVLQPDYRQHRSHGRFLMNLGVSAAAVKTALISMWEAAGVMTEFPSQRVAELVLKRYGRREWNFRR